MSASSATTGLLRPITHITRTRPGYVCLRCRQCGNTQLLPLSSQATTHLVSRRNASTSQDNTPFTEKIRRKIWGTQNPPGQVDPYGNASLFDKSKQRAEEEQLESEIRASQSSTTRAGGPSTDVDYVPATTWDGLDQIGGASGWWEDAWDEQHQFTGFIPATALETNNEIRNAIQRAVVEVSVLKAATRPLTDASRMPSNSNVNFSGAEFSKAKGSSFSVTFADPTTQTLILESVGTKDAPADEFTQSIGEAAEREAVTNSDEIILGGSTVEKDVESFDALPTNNGAWLGVSLQDQTFKFAVLKRVLQLTGKRIPDPVISKIHDVRKLVDVMTETPKPKKLAERLITQPLATMPNVQIFERRYTPIDKEKEVGRWKVIERELQKRGLPVTGRA